MALFTKQFWATTLEVVLFTAVSAFSGSLVLTTTPEWKNFAAAGIAAGVAALGAFVKQLGGVQAVNAASSKSSVNTK